MLSELITLRKKIAEYEKGDARVVSLEKEKAQLERDVDYWKEEVRKALQWQVECHSERKRRNELKVVFDNTYAELKQASKLVQHLRADRVGNEKVNRVLQEKIRLMEAEIAMHKRQREFEQGLRVAAEARAEEASHRFSSERAERLQSMHKVNKEQVKVFESEKREKEATLKSIETSQAASELCQVIRVQEARLESDQHIMATQHRELTAQATEIEQLRRESANLRRIIVQKGEEVMSFTYRYLELEKELWRIQREAGQALQLLRTSSSSSSSSSSSDRGMLITRPSVLSERKWSPSALTTVIAQHRREGLALSHALVTASSSSSSSASSACSTSYGGVWPPLPATADGGFGSNGPTSSAHHDGRSSHRRHHHHNNKTNDHNVSTVPLEEEARATTTATTTTYNNHDHMDAAGCNTAGRGGGGGAAAMVCSNRRGAHHHHHQDSGANAKTMGAGGGTTKGTTSSLLTKGSVFVGLGLGLRKEQDDYFSQMFTGSAKESLKRAMARQQQPQGPAV